MDREAYDGWRQHEERHTHTPMWSKIMQLLPSTADLHTIPVFPLRATVPYCAHHVLGQKQRPSAASQRCHASRTKRPIWEPR